MHIVHVHVRVKPEAVEAFRAASLENASHSVQEPGITQFHLFQQKDEPTRFLLVEVYRTEADNAAHRETAHYAKWRDAVEDMMAEPRRRVIYVSAAPAPGV